MATADEKKLADKLVHDCMRAERVEEDRPMRRYFAGDQGERQRLINYVYVAGPYSHGSQAENVRVALEAANQFRELGLYPYVPHLSHFWHFAFPRGYEDWMRLDMAWIKRCDAVLRLPGMSPGADRECAFARELGLPVFDRVTSLVAASVRA